MGNHGIIPSSLTQRKVVRTGVTSGIDNPVRHNEEAEWLNEVTADLRDYKVQSNVVIALKDVKDLAEKAC